MALETVGQPRECGNLVALGPLQGLLAGFKKVQSGLVPDASFRRRAVLHAVRAGRTCMPLLLRSLASNDEAMADLAAYLLERTLPRLAERAPGARECLRLELQRLLGGETLGENVRWRAELLLGELSPDAEAKNRPRPSSKWRKNVPQAKESCPRVVKRTAQRKKTGRARGRTPLEHSVLGLLESLHEPEDYRGAAELILGQVEEPEILHFCKELLAHGGDPAAKLVRALGELSGNPALLGAVAEPRTTSSVGAHDVFRRGILKLDQGDAAAAVNLLHRYVKNHPADVRAQSYLGISLLALGRAKAALGPLELACELEPDCATHYFHLACAAQQAKHIGRCYLALRTYLAMSDSQGDALLRPAARYVAQYERLVARNHPGVEPLLLAQAEERFLRALDLLCAGRSRAAARVLRQVLKAVPNHHASWSNLGTAYAVQGHLTAAARCFRRALEILPGDKIARQNLEHLEPSALA